ncbi:ShlB/FhaC/HecB family hemolysin secretion/activation protein [Serratia liquefaciens]|uniref:ShlB/FhaC/HecB family hemolysin secretion/activation protein n=1 Tax=Serratia liquefaciens TaxID=614 RepID=UPI0021588577|nr:ShlB/FhaC/HecB family hemolysin secretion/activation protein [Serratia liquefaciens]CAI1811461.1 Hemolysin transporter protein shlB precursor [Serratia liquefaciens]
MKIYHIALLVVFIFPVNSFSSSISVSLEQQAISQEHTIINTLKKLSPTQQAILTPQTEELSDGVFFPQEKSCWKVKKVVLISQEDPGSFIRHLSQSANGRCLGVVGVSNLQRAMQNYIIEQGLITTRVIISNYHQATGALTVIIAYGRVGEIKLTANSSHYFHPDFTFPLRHNEVLNLRNIEQGLENMNLMPNAVSTIRIVPGEEPGQSDIEVFRKQSKYWRLTTWADDSGSRATGRYQGGLALFLDNVTSLNDVFYGSITRNFPASGHRGNNYRSLNYSIPYGFWSLNLFTGNSRYHQQIIGNGISYRYLGASEYWGGQISRTLWRGRSQKTTLSSQLLQRKYYYYLNDTEINLQRSRLSSLKLSVNHLHYFERAKINLSLDYTKSMSWFNARREADAARPFSHIIRANASLLSPFSWSDFSLRYLGELSLQTSNYALPIQDKSSIGDRTTVRGFSGDYKLLGSSGGYWRNTIALDSRYIQPYAGIDYGYIMKKNDDFGGALAGGVIGLRASKWNAYVDIFAGAPLIKPMALPADQTVLGFSVQMNF